MPDPSLIIALTGLIVSLGSVAGAWFSSRIAARKNELDAVTTRMQAAIDQVGRDNERLRVRIDELEADNAEMRKTIRDLEKERSSNLKRIDQLECQVAELEAQLTAAGITPATKKGDCK